MIDLICSALLVVVALVTTAAYAGRVAVRGAASSARVEREGQSALLGKAPMEMFHWLLEPFAAGAAYARVGANAVTWSSLVLALFAGVALAFDHDGIGAALATVAAAGDALDGAIARRTNTASDAGEVLDAAVDRYSEFAFLGGLALRFHASESRLALTLAALLASFMVSYSTAKAEALQVTPPRGSMRRTERAVYLIVGAGLGPLVAAIQPAFREVPLLLALGLVALLGNASAVRRLGAIIAQTRGARPPKSGRSSSEAPSPPLRPNTRIALEPSGGEKP